MTFLVFAQVFVLQALSLGDRFKKVRSSTRSSLKGGGGGASGDLGGASGGAGGGAGGAGRAGPSGGASVADLRQGIVVAGAVLKHFQTIGLVSTMNIELPQEVLNFISSFRFLTPEFNVALGFACLTDGEFDAALVWTWLLPWIIVCVCVVAFVLSKMIIPLS